MAAAPVVYGAALLFLAVIWFSAVRAGIPIKSLMRDPNSILKGPFYVGFVSNLGVVVWTIGAAVALFAWSVLRERGASRETLRLFFMGGILTTILLLDDVFMFHEEIFPDYLFPKRSALHMSEHVVVGLYALYGMLFLYLCRREIARTDRRYLILAIVLLALSVISERNVSKLIFTGKDFRAFAEDAFKFLGICGWTYYFSRTARQAIIAPFEDMRE